MTGARVGRVRSAAVRRRRGATGAHQGGIVAGRGQTVRRVTVRARLDNSERRLLPEMFVRAYIFQDRGTGVCVPNSAIVNQGVYTFVYVQTAPGEFLRRKVTLLTSGGDFSCVGEGLKADENVVITGALLLDAELTARIGDKP